MVTDKDKIDLILTIVNNYYEGSTTHDEAGFGDGVISSIQAVALYDPMSGITVNDEVCRSRENGAWKGEQNG